MLSSIWKLKKFYIVAIIAGYCGYTLGEKEGVGKVASEIPEKVLQHAALVYHYNVDQSGEIRDITGELAVLPNGLCYLAKDGAVQRFREPDKVKEILFVLLEDARALSELDDDYHTYNGPQAVMLRLNVVMEYKISTKKNASKVPESVHKMLLELIDNAETEDYKPTE